MYKKILVCLDGNMDTDEHILDHIAGVARCMSSTILLLRVAHYHTRDMKVAELEGTRDYYAEVKARLEAHGVTDVAAIEASGEPSETIVRIAEENGVDLIAMSTHGHGFVYDMLFGSVSEQVRHRTELPVLLLRHPARE